METKKAVDYIYSIAEMEMMLGEVGLDIIEIYSIPEGRDLPLENREHISSHEKDSLRLTRHPRFA